MKITNKQILLTCHSMNEREWMGKKIIGLFAQYRGGNISRKDMMKLPIEERHKIMEKQANKYLSN